MPHPERPLATTPATDAAVDQATDLCGFLDAAPSPYHAVGEVRRRLVERGFSEIDESAPWPRQRGRHLVSRGGTLVAWSTEDPARVEDGFRIVGAHTDSPNLRIKPRADAGQAGWRQLGVEVYGGVLLNSWLDRDLGLSGRVAVRSGSDGGAEVRLVRDDRPLLRVPQLAIHLDRGVNDGLKLNPQTQMTPVWGTGSVDEGGFRAHLADLAEVEPGDVLSWDVMAHDLTPATLLGLDRSLLAGARIDNLLSCHAGTSALLRALDEIDDGAAGSHRPVPVVCLFDHEEVGSESSSGASGSVLATVLERIALGAGVDRDGWFAALARSACISADGAHATHPNYTERHEPAHHVAVNAGPVVKANANVRYATDAPSAALVRLAAEAAAVPLQEFVVRTDMPCGSTIGPVTAARLGVPTVDVGVAQLSMHSARELCGSADPELFARLLVRFLRP
ncbi:M18 family aminopeptidase [Rhabdothermincola salaria]|uniref:M18 family aminopeptidase n=1 Tax=Rhabdothermincola salaria TaxID=2903142 RepID=UPI001E384CFF|nr:M18 family aminopeptidase [Rhabdothermincola salaria]